ncbi:alpha/beta fold hydrolase [Marinagarivorans algicola]|uniref:alpha/beta fold hydrolase n=1 Tax=Marinagarivorans algicola TaxID=1513270 RepID=UPI0006B9D142|nr:alpha/beta fold hydrolase [Marinagarivorans algicola]
MPAHDTPAHDTNVEPQPLYFRKQGQGEPVVILHGLFGSMENLGAQARALAKHFCVYSIDLPNHGRSAHGATMTLSSMAAQVNDWMEAQGLPSASFVGHSLGGKVAMELVLQQPEKCQKLVVLDIAPVHYEPHHTKVFKGLLALNPAQLVSRTDADTQLKREVSEPAVRSFLLKNLVKEAQGFSWRMNLPVIYASYPNLITANTLPETPYEGDVLFIKGGKSDYILEQHRDAIAARFPKAKLRLVSGVGHWLHAEKPEHVAQLVMHFLQH